MNTSIITLPIVLIILGGYLAVKLKLFNQEMSDTLISLLFYVIMPITLFFHVSQLPLTTTLAWGYMGAYFLSSISVITLCTLLSRYLFKRDIPNLIINAMGATHSNTAYLALPIFLMLFHTAAPVASIIIVQTVFNFMILFGLDVSTKRSGRKLGVFAIGMLIFENPILLGTLLGLACSYFNVHLPSVLYATCKITSQSASFIALFALGLSLDMPQTDTQRTPWPEITLIVLLKCFMHPCMAYLIGRYGMHLSGFTLKSVVLMAAMPSAKNTFVFAKRYAVGAQRANLLVLLATLVSMISIDVLFQIL